ncbi:MAG TPA: rRNA maturation RNase YbeY [Dehalococcoidia bacterium]|nr:rRNA maturation RNase YbeY [Dehalococcoidia bacterium]
MEINVLIDEGLEGCLDVGWLQSIAEQILIAQNAGSNVELGVVITTQQRVQQLNRSYLGRDEPTDVLAFSMLPAAEEIGADLPPFVTPPDGVIHLGEVIISHSQAVIQAEEQHHSIRKEIATLITHGLLHLLGYKDDNPELKLQMSAKETELLTSIGEIG